MQYGKLLTDLRLRQSLHQLITLYDFFGGGGFQHKNLPEYIYFKTPYHLAQIWSQLIIKRLGPKHDGQVQ